MTMLGEKTVIARKPHKCYWCGEVINKGEAYVRWAWVDGSPITTRAHPECRDAWGEAANEWGDPDYETLFAQHKRGCTCESGERNCPHEKKG